MTEKHFLNRELSWLSFNHRVLQETLDDKVPLHEKIKFMAIFSSNLDEFFRVRVAALRYLMALKEKTRKKLEFEPAALLEAIHTQVNIQQEELGKVYKNIIKELESHGINLVRESAVNKEQTRYIREYFTQEVQPFIQPIFLIKNKVNYFLQNKSLYLAVKLFSRAGKKPGTGRARYALLEIPSLNLPRFISLPDINGRHYLMFIDDVIRCALDLVFPGYHVDSNFSVKLTRDAEIYIEDEFSGDLVEKIRQGIARRKTGAPSRFLYDQEMPKDFLKFIRDVLQLSKEDLIPGGRYHNFSDFFTFPPLGPDHLQYRKLPPVMVKPLADQKSVFKNIAENDILLHFPYHSYDPVINFFRACADDPKVTDIFITLYRVASGSRIVENLIRAVQNGKKVTAFVEVKARFDEASNIKWAEEMKRAGVQVLYSFPGLKVHAKVCLVLRGAEKYVYLATGNFNEKTARIYTDFGLFTAKKEITADTQKLFTYLVSGKDDTNYRRLLVAPFNMRKEFYALIDREITNAKAGKTAAITLKLNSIEDKKIINKLYDASRAGVNITILVRGICCLAPGVEKLSENIQVFSIIDRFLEHTRVYIFHNLGRREFYLASADWMRRNLSRRIEIAFPVTDTHIKKQISDIIDIQLSDQTKARIIDKNLKNQYRKSEDGQSVNAQLVTYEYIKSQN